MSHRRKPGPVATVKSGSIRIPIYRTKDYFLAKWDEGGQPRRKQSTDLEKLRDKVRPIAKRLAKGVVDLSELSPEQLAMCREAVRRGITLKDLDSIRSVTHVTLREAADRLLVAKSDTSTAHQRTLKTHLKVFCDWRALGKRPLTSIDVADIDAFLAQVDGLRTRTNYRATVVSLFRFSRDKGWLPLAERTVAERSDRPSARRMARDREPVLTWSPAELKKILEHVSAPYLPWVVLSAFAGLRTLELFADEAVDGQRKRVLRWEDIDLEAGRILVPEATAKTAHPRAIPIVPTLASWLRVIGPKRGTVCTTLPPWKGRNEKAKLNYLGTLAEQIGQPWKRNALRHSFGTYRYLQTQSVGPVALEMGNSEAIIRRNYHDVKRTVEEAEEWFALGPDQVERGLRVSA